MAVKRTPREGKTDWISIQCDGCGAAAPPAEEIRAGHGLNHMGWRCSGGTHLCPECGEKGDA